MKLREEIENLVGYSFTDGCLLFQGPRTKDGYGRVKVQGKNVLAHRYSFEYHIGPIGDSCVCHTCDTPLCFNPDHLALGTHYENMQDMKLKGRSLGTSSQPGEGNSQARLREKDVYMIHILRFLGVRVSTLADHFEVSVRHVYSLLSGRRWAHVIHRDDEFLDKLQKEATTFMGQVREGRDL